MTQSSGFAPEGQPAAAVAARQHNNRGVLRQLEGDLDTARAEYQAALEGDPSSATAHNNIGYLCAQAGQWQEAISHYERALELDPQRSLAAVNLGVARAATGDVPGGIAALERAVELDAANVLAWDNLARLCLLAGRLDAAEAAWRGGLEFAPDDARLVLGLGTTVATQQRVDEAVPLLRRAVALDPNSASAWTQ